MEDRYRRREGRHRTGEVEEVGGAHTTVLEEEAEEAIEIEITTVDLHIDHARDLPAEVRLREGDGVGAIPLGVEATADRRRGDEGPAQ